MAIFFIFVANVTNFLKLFKYSYLAHDLSAFGLLKETKTN